MQATALAGVTFFGVYLVLFLPALLGASNGLILYIAALTVGVQAAQSSVIQVGRQPNFALARNPSLMAAAAVCLTALAALGSFDPLFDAVLATTSGAILGITLGRSGLIVLGGKGGTAYQSFQATRSIGFVVAAVASTIAEKFVPNAAPIVATIVVAALSFFSPRVGRRRLGFTSPELLTGRAAWSVLLGLLASLFYRNDVNWVRTAVANAPDFLLWHYALIAYGAVQGIIGFLVVQLIFSSRQAWRTRVVRWAGQFGWQFAGLWTASVVVAVIVAPQMPIVLSVALCSVLAAVVGIMSGLAHVVELNWVPYLAGVLGVALLSLSLMLQVDTRLAIVIENAVIGSVILVLILVLRRPACNFFR